MLNRQKIRRPCLKKYVKNSILEDARDGSYGTKKERILCSLQDASTGMNSGWWGEFIWIDSRLEAAWSFRRSIVDQLEIMIDDGHNLIFDHISVDGNRHKISGSAIIVALVLAIDSQRQPTLEAYQGEAGGHEEAESNLWSRALTWAVENIVSEFGREWYPNEF